MKYPDRLILPLLVAALSVPTLAACQPSGDASRAQVSGTPASTTPSAHAQATDAQATDRTQKTPDMSKSCYVHLFDDDNFKDDNDIIYGPGKWSTLRNLPGATESDWGGDADSLKVGPSATVRIWSKKDFKGQMQEFGPATEKPSLDDEPESMEITCG